MTSNKKGYVAISSKDHFYVVYKKDLLVSDWSTVKFNDEVTFKYGRKEYIGTVKSNLDTEDAILDIIKDLKKSRPKRASSFDPSKQRKAAVKQRENLQGILGNKKGSNPTADNPKKLKREKERKVKMAKEKAALLMEDQIEPGEPASGSPLDVKASDSADDSSASDSSPSSLDLRSGKKKEFGQKDAKALRDIYSSSDEDSAPLNSLKHKMENDGDAGPSQGKKPRLSENGSTAEGTVIPSGNGTDAGANVHQCPSDSDHLNSSPLSAAAIEVLDIHQQENSSAKPGSPHPFEDQEQVFQDKGDDKQMVQDADNSESLKKGEQPDERKHGVTKDSEQGAKSKKIKDKKKDKKKKDSKKKSKKPKRQRSIMVPSSDDEDTRGSNNDFNLGNEDGSNQEEKKSKKKKKDKEKSKKGKKSKRSKKSKKSKKRKEVKRNLTVYPGHNFKHPAPKDDKDKSVVKLHPDFEVYVTQEDVNEMSKVTNATRFVRGLVERVYTKEAILGSTPQGYPPRGKGRKSYSDKNALPRLHPAGLNAIITEAKRLQDEVNKTWRPKATDRNLKSAFSVRCCELKAHWADNSSSSSSSDSSDEDSDSSSSSSSSASSSSSTE